MQYTLTTVHKSWFTLPSVLKHYGLVHLLMHCALLFS